jgi:hypothetical protein
VRVNEGSNSALKRGCHAEASIYPSRRDAVPAFADPEPLADIGRPIILLLHPP